MDFRSYLPRIFWTGIILIITGILSNIGEDLWYLIKRSVSSYSSTLSWTTFPWTTLRDGAIYILSIIGIFLVIWSIWKNRSIKTSSRIPYKIQTSESKLDDLIQELDSFINKWHYTSFLNSSYRKQVDNKWIAGDRKEIRKIKEHSREIHKKIRPLRKLKINDSEGTIDSLTEIADRMAEFALEIESTFPTTKSMPETDKIKKLVSDGDIICDDLKQVILHLEKLRRYLP